MNRYYSFFFSVIGNSLGIDITVSQFNWKELGHSMVI